MKTVKVKLNINEVLVATYIGSRRNAESLYRNREPRFPERNIGELWGFHIESAHAELCVAKKLGIYWGYPVNTFHTPDIVNTNIEVRWSNRGTLKIRPTDKGVVVSVSGKCPEYEIHGWIAAAAGKLEKYKYHKPPECFFCAE